MQERKVIFYYRHEEELRVETMWTRKVDQGYAVDNIPFFVTSIAYDDIISLEEEDGAFYFEQLVQVSGNSTIRIIVFDVSSINEVTTKIESFGCDWETVGSILPGLIAVNVPKDMPYSNIRTFLEEGELAGRWSYEEACLGHK